MVDELTREVLNIKAARQKDPWAPGLVELTGEQTKIWGEGIWLNIRKKRNEMRTKADFVARRVGMDLSMDIRTISERRLTGMKLTGMVGPCVQRWKRRIIWGVPFRNGNR
jgi:hypothetical protein